jgi:hypothetical protein
MLAGFEKWWQEDGRMIDPDTEDVPWFDKRKGKKNANRQSSS